LRKELPSLIVTTAASNVNGVIFPVEEISRLAAEKGIPICIDAAQAAGETSLFPEKWGIDFFCFSGHKSLLGPAGTGGLYIRDPERLSPLKRGGTGSRSSEEIQPDVLPDKFESGTQNIPGLAGWLHSMTYLKTAGTAEQTNREHESFLEKLRSLDKLEIIGHPPEVENLSYTSVISVYPKNRPLSVLTEILNRNDIAVRNGLHCAPGAHKTLQTFERGGTIRFSTGPFNTTHEIQTVYDLLKESL
jgi:selenocysteine lyase/cysteine desulfurase